MKMSSAVSTKTNLGFVHNIALFALASFLIVLLQSCCPVDPYEDYLHLTLTTEPKTLDPVYSTDITTGVLTTLMYDNLVRFDAGTKIIPGLAKSWEISEDGLSYTFQLRSDVVFWDSTPLTAADVQYSFQRLLNPDTGSPQTWLLSPLLGSNEYMQGNAGNIRGISVVNDTTITLILHSPFTPFLGFLGAPATAIVSYEARSNEPRDLKSNPLGTGPWMFDEWVADRHIRLKVNETYYTGPAKLKGLILNNSSEVLTTAIEFEAGNLDIISVPNSEFNYWTRSDIWRPYVHKLDELGIYYLAMNVERAPFNDVRVRQAITYAIDREKIIQRVLHHSVTLAKGVIPPGLVGYDSTRVPQKYDREKARALLEEAGYPDGCSFDLWVDPGAAISQTIEAIQHYLNEAGFDVRLVRNDWNMMRDAMRQGQTDAYWGNWWADYADAENFLAPLFHSSNASRRNRYSNPYVDQRIEALQQESQPARRHLLATSIDSVLIAEAPYAFMWYPTSYTVVQPNVRGYRPHLMPNANKYTEVYFEK